MNKFYDEFKLEVGVDEAGRGSLLGNVYAGAVILDKEDKEMKIIDSKKLTPRNRLILKDYIEENAIDFAVGLATSKEIDQLNIQNASILAMHRALNNLNVSPELILVDGPKFKLYFRETSFISHVCINNGDNLYESIAAGSILAKVHHDKHIEELVKNNPELDEYYDISNNMGYGTVKHMDGLKKYGPSKYHRYSYKPVSDNIRNSEK